MDWAGRGKYAEKRIEKTRAFFSFPSFSSAVGLAVVENVHIHVGQHTGACSFWPSKGKQCKAHTEPRMH